MNELIYLIEIDRKISIDTHLLDLFPDEVYARNRGPLLPVAVDRIHLRGLRGRLQGELTVKPLRVVSFNIIIVCPRRETIYHESERTKKKERGGGETVPFHATSMPYPNPNTPIPSRKRTIFPWNEFMAPDPVAPLEILFSASSPFLLLAEHRRVIDVEGAERGNKKLPRANARRS